MRPAQVAKKPTAAAQGIPQADTAKSGAKRPPEEAPEKLGSSDIKRTRWDNERKYNVEVHDWRTWLPQNLRKRILQCTVSPGLPLVYMELANSV